MIIAALKRLLSAPLTAIGIKPRHSLVHAGKVYDARFYRISQVSDAPPMCGMGAGYDWVPDTRVEKKQWWEPTYGTPYAMVSDMPKDRQERTRAR